MALVITPPSSDVFSSRESMKHPKYQTEALELVNVFLRMWDGKTLCCTIDPSHPNTTTIALLEKHVITSYPHNNKNDFYFVLQGKPLRRNNCELATWKNGCTVFVQYRNRGGCFIISFTILCIIMTAIVGSTCTCGASLLIVPVLLPFLFILPLFCL